MYSVPMSSLSFGFRFAFHNANIPEKSYPVKCPAAIRQWSTYWLKRWLVYALPAIQPVGIPVVGPESVEVLVYIYPLEALTGEKDFFAGIHRVRDDDGQVAVLEQSVADESQVAAQEDLLPGAPLFHSIGEDVTNLQAVPDLFPGFVADFALSSSLARQRHRNKRHETVSETPIT